MFVKLLQIIFAVIFVIVTLTRCLKLFKYNNLTPTTQDGYSSAGENRCRKWLEETFGVPFPRVRPEWLKNDVTNRNLELDCYNEDLKLAVEFNGKQHYEYHPRFHMSQEDYEYSQYKDELKKTLCLENKVELIVVPYWEKDIEGYLFDNISSS